MNDKFFMKRAFELAEKGRGFVSPNPMVGAVIVKKGKTVAEGWHKVFGGPHAEIVALKNARTAGKNIKGGVLYVNLEPCAHFGKKTPPCAPEVKKAGFSRIVIAMRDPNPKTKGMGIKLLRSKGLRVDVGCLENEAKILNEKYIKWISTGLPFVTVKIAISLDGKITTRTGDSKWITSERSRALVHELRDSEDAILIGSNTVMKDNPRLSGKNRDPMRIVLDSKLRAPSSAKIFRDNNVLIATTNKAPRRKIDFYKKRGIHVESFGEKININPLLRFLGKRGISSVFVEGGAKVFNSFINGNFADKFYIFIAPKIIGNSAKMKDAQIVKNAFFERIASDILIKAQKI